MKYLQKTSRNFCQPVHTPIGCVYWHEIGKEIEKFIHLNLYSKVSEVPQSGIHVFRLTPTFNLATHPVGVCGWATFGSCE